MYMLMCMAKTIALALFRQDLSGIVEEVATTHERVVVTRHGEPVAVLIAIDDLEALEETLEILADVDLVTAIHRSLKSTKRYSMTQVRDRLAKRSPA